jgi:hypothetical protein
MQVIVNNLTKDCVASQEFAHYFCRDQDQECTPEVDKFEAELGDRLEEQETTTIIAVY